MKIGIDLRPLQEYSRFRGIGTVVFEITKALVENFPRNSYFFYFYKDLPISEDLKPLLRNGQTIYLDQIKRGSVLDTFARGRRDITVNERLDVFLATDPGKDLPKGNFKKVVIFYDLITLNFTERYLKSSSGSLPINIFKFIKLLRFKFIKKTLEEKFRSALEADKILSISEATKKDIIDYFKISGEKITVMHLAAAEFFQKLENLDRKSIQIKYSLKDKFIFYVGGLDYRKNILNLLKAIELIKDNNFPQLIIGGKDISRQTMPEAMEIRDFIEKKNLDSKVKLLSYIENTDLVKFYNLAEFFVFPTLYEGFGLGVLEAMACETPVVCSNTPAIKEVAGEAVLYFDPNKPDDIADKLILLNENKTLRAGLVKKGKEQIKKFSWKNASTKAYESFQK